MTISNDQSKWIQHYNNTYHQSFSYDNDKEGIFLNIYLYNTAKTFSISRFHCEDSSLCTKKFKSSKMFDSGKYIGPYLKMDSGDKTEIEEILRICDSIFPLSEELVKTVVKFINVKEYKITHLTFNIFNNLKENIRSIHTFLLCMNRWKIENKIIIPKVLQMKILCNITDKELGPVEFKQNFKWIQEE